VNITRYSEHEDLDKAINENEPLLAIIAFDGKQAYMGHIYCFIRSGCPAVTLTNIFGLFLTTRAPTGLSSVRQAIKVSPINSGE